MSEFPHIPVSFSDWTISYDSELNLIRVHATAHYLEHDTNVDSTLTSEGEGESHDVTVTDLLRRAWSKHVHAHTTPTGPSYPSATPDTGGSHSSDTRPHPTDPESTR